MSTVFTKTVFTSIDSPVGRLLLVATDGALSRVDMMARDGFRAGDDVGNGVDNPRHPVLRLAARQLDEYFAGARTRFELPLRLDGTAFQRRVWQALTEIPYGETRSYGALARALARPGASRAVGSANGRNPVGIIVPCHRVIASDGSLGGYAGGMPAKRWLLALEAAPAARTQEREAIRTRAPTR
jgi:methylated-DNA-[protein]-cysteine S-methyltransferase